MRAQFFLDSKRNALLQKSQDLDCELKQKNNLKISWGPLLFISAMHLACIPAFFIFNFQALAICLGLYFATACLGITLTYHRLLTHRSFKIYKPLEYFFALLGCLACQGGPIKWVATHRLHHSYPDEVNDPHSPTKGFWWAHIGWLFFINPATDQPKEYFQLAPDLAKDPAHVFLDKTYLLWTFLLAAVLYILGGWTFVVWGVAVRIVFVYHVTWLVNSAAHIWGYRTYQAEDQSMNLWWVALLSWGEGWHNNHHAFQYSARHGLKKSEIDITFMVIRALNFLGLVNSIKTPTFTALQRKAGEKIKSAPYFEPQSNSLLETAEEMTHADYEVPV